MAEPKVPTTGSHTDTDWGRSYLPAMGHRRLLALYEPFTRLVGLPRVHRELLERAELRSGQRVLEIGCGPGTLLRLARSQHPDIDLVGLDPDPDALDRARRRLGIAARLDRGFADALPYPDASVDRVLSSFMWHHLEPADKPAALREIARVLRPGGRLHLVDIAGAGPRHWLLRKRHTHHSFDRPDDLVTLLRDAGLTDIAVVQRSSRRLGMHAFYRATR